MRVGDQELAPGWTAYESRLRYQTYDVTDLLAAGENVVGAWLGDGWWRGHLGWDGRKDLYGTELGVLVQLEIEYADGERQVVASGPDWTAADGPDPLVGPLQRRGLRRAPARRRHGRPPALDTAGWDAGRGPRPRCRHARRAGRSAGAARRDARRAARSSRRRPGRRSSTSGRTSSAGCASASPASAGDVITLRHAEVLEHGELATGPLRAAKATDTYTLAGDGEETWAPRFTFHGFRYAEVTGWPGDLDPAAVTAEVLHSDMERTGWFAASDPLVDRLHQNVVWGMRGNFVDVPTDCPQRDERLGWTGDLQVFAPTAEYLYDSAGFLTSWLKDLAAEQQRYDGTTMVVPAITTGYHGPDGRVGGCRDRRAVDALPRLRRPGSARARSSTAWPRGSTRSPPPRARTGCGVPGFQFGDWLDPTAPAERPEAAQTYPEIVATAYFARSARIVADAAALLGREEEAARYGALADEVGTAFHREYVSRSGRVLSDSATAYALALQFDLIADPAERQPCRRSARRDRPGQRLQDLHRLHRHSADLRRAQRQRPRRCRVPAAAADREPVLALHGQDGRDHDLGTVGLAAARRHGQPERDDLVQPLRLRRGRRLDAPRRRGPRARRARLPAPADRPAAAAARPDRGIRSPAHPVRRRVERVDARRRRRCGSRSTVPVGATAEVVLPSGRQP